MVVGYASTRTGLRALDMLLAFAAARLVACVIELQRNYGRYSPAFRERTARRVITAGTWGATLFGVALFGLIAAAAVASAVITFRLPATRYAGDGLEHFVLLATFAVGAVGGVWRAFQHLQVGSLIHATPKAALARLLVDRPFRTTTMATFAAFELGVVITGVLSTSLVCDLVVALARIVRA